MLESLRKLIIIAIIAAAFLIGLMSTIYFSVRGREVTVPAITGKLVWTGESELESAGLNLRRRATRYSTEVKSDTILDQSPRAGQIVKVGQTIAVVVSRETAKEGESAATVAEDAKDKDEGEPTDQASAGSNTDDTTEPATKNVNRNRERRNRNANANAKGVANTNAGNVNNRGITNINRNLNPTLRGNSNIRSANTNIRNVNATPPLLPRTTNTANVNRRTPAAAAIPTPSKAVTNPRVP